ncbi:CinA family protein [Caballeronia sp. LZ008]|uniref:CinA family protein n=1 Tax=Caballeronia sp. LZ008 TaxID=3038560 RepID=UPI0038D3B0B7
MPNRSRSRNRRSRSPKYAGVADSPPDGGPPAGTQCFAWSYKRGGDQVTTFSETKKFEGERNEIRSAAARYALSRIAHYFEKSTIS